MQEFDGREGKPQVGTIYPLLNPNIQAHKMIAEYGSHFEISLCFYLPLDAIKCFQRTINTFL